MTDVAASKVEPNNGPYEIDFDHEALMDLREYRPHDQKLIADGIIEQLTYEPTVETRHRKLLRPNPVARWELRLGEFRVFYNVEQSLVTVLVVAIGHKEHNRLHIRDQRVKL